MRLSKTQVLSSCGRTNSQQWTSTFAQLNISADAAAARKHFPHGDWAGQVWLTIVWNVNRHWQVQILLLDAAVANTFSTIPQSFWLVVDLLRRRRLKVERQIIVRARWTEGLRACQFSSQRRGGENGGAIGHGGGGSRRRHNVVVRVNRWDAGRDSKVRLLLLRLWLLLLTAIILERGKKRRLKRGREGKMRENVRMFRGSEYFWKN